MDFNEMHGGSLNELIAAESGIPYLTEAEMVAVLDINEPE